MIAGASRKLPLAAIAASAAGVAVALAASSGISGHAGECGKPWVFFDLGNTVVASAPGQESKYVPGAHAYVRELRKRGYSIGLITNVPEKWGTTRTAKIRALKKLIDETWTKDAGAERMDWSDFPDSAIVIPRRDFERKPSPYLFAAARAHVALEEGTRDCPVFYQGEDAAEVATAEAAGLSGYVVGRDPAAPFLPVERLEARR